jgi:hypothetical protein
MKRFIVKEGKGVALFRKFDDSWRIDKISMDYSNTKFILKMRKKRQIFI